MVSCDIGTPLDAGSVNPVTIVVHNVTVGDHVGPVARVEKDTIAIVGDNPAPADFIRRAATIKPVVGIILAVAIYRLAGIQIKTRGGIIFRQAPLEDAVVT